ESRACWRWGALFRQGAAYAVAGAAGVDGGGAPGLSGVGGGDFLLEAFDGALLDEADGAAAEACAGEPRAVAAWHGLGGGGEYVEFVDADFVVVAQAGVRFVHQLAEGGHVARLKGGGAFDGPFVFADD